MVRWEADAAGRLQHAAMSLYLERGYDAVTVAEIAERAGLTKRTFFRHFPDKREAVFAGAPAFLAAVASGVADAGPGAAPMDAVLAGFAAGAARLAEYAPYQRQVRALIASSADLQEREHVKNAAVAAAVAEALGRRGVDPLTARLAAHAGGAVFAVAYDRWVDDGATGDLPALLRETRDAMRSVLG
ncbi:helix-turn-helix domain-containing protein [Modestobacter sp. NPDC049651]|uniref:TetR/AcrR family transcriptional regulator n=1 Tax=unclassified Modestobacter TaxID=2643866 RepID=UPI0033D98217